MEPLGDGGQYVGVQGVKAVTTTQPEMAEIKVSGAPVFGGRDVGLFYHFEGEESGYRRCLMPRSRAEWIALGRRLADFFGGKVDYDDSDGVGYDYEVPPRTDTENCPEDGRPWKALQARIHALAPLSKAEIQACQDSATYT